MQATYSVENVLYTGKHVNGTGQVTTPQTGPILIKIHKIYLLSVHQNNHGHYLLDLKQWC